jgi:hypothetical protein
MNNCRRSLTSFNEYTNTELPSQTPTVCTREGPKLSTTLFSFSTSLRSKKLFNQLLNIPIPILRLDEPDLDEHSSNSSTRRYEIHHCPCDHNRHLASILLLRNPITHNLANTIATFARLQPVSQTQLSTTKSIKISYPPLLLRIIFPFDTCQCLCVPSEFVVAGVGVDYACAVIGSDEVGGAFLVCLAVC